MTWGSRVPRRTRPFALTRTPRRLGHAPIVARHAGGPAESQRRGAPRERQRCEAIRLTRHVLIRSDSGDQLVAESALPAEASLHDALADRPQLIPAADLGLGRAVVMGRESRLASGKADLILVDEMGQVCLVEVKKEGNPDTRQFVAQLLDYATSLWGQTLDEFTERVLRPYLRERSDDASIGLEDFVTASFGAGDDVDENEIVSTDVVTRNLAATLQAGTFVLVVAAPQIPTGVERALEYLNAQGLRVYALEVGYFRGQVECFVPRVSVSPPPTTRSRTSTVAPAAPVEREGFLESLGESVAPVVADSTRRGRGSRGTDQLGRLRRQDQGGARDATADGFDRGPPDQGHRYASARVSYRSVRSHKEPSRRARRWRTEYGRLDPQSRLRPGDP